MSFDKLTKEQALIRRLLKSAGSTSTHNLIVPNGDDAAVIQVGSNWIAVTTDTLVENRHFSFQYYSPKQVGLKAVESTVSDIIAMGGLPKQLVIALSLTKQSTDLLEEVYQGIYSSAARVGAVVIGGDVASGSSELIISMTALGEIPSERELCRRSGANPGDLIFVTGPLGGSAAGLEALKNNLDDYKTAINSHLEPKCRNDLIVKIAPHASSMIDISDGLSSELYHICRESGCGAVVVDDNIPIDPETKQIAEILNLNPVELAYSGGEDYELLYTLPPHLKNYGTGSQIGLITEETELYHVVNERKIPLPLTGFDHLIAPSDAEKTS